MNNQYVNLTPQQRMAQMLQQQTMLPQQQQQIPQQQSPFAQAPAMMQMYLQNKAKQPQQAAPVENYMQSGD
jgi:hypothetical protein